MKKSAFARLFDSSFVSVTSVGFLGIANGVLAFRGGEDAAGDG